MKKTILFAALALISAGAIAQSKTDSTKKPAAAAVQAPAPVPFNPDNVALKHVDPVLNLKLQSYLISDFFFYEQYGPEALDNADRLTARQVTLLKKNHQLVMDSIKVALARKYYSEFLTAEKKHYDDSVAKASKPLTPIK